MSTLNPDDRAAWIDGLRSLACFLEAHPDVPVPERYHTQYLSVIPRGSEDECRVAVDAVAAMLGVIPDDRDGQGHYKAVRPFGPVAYEVFFISDAWNARYDALNSYSGSVRLDDPVVAA